MDQLLKITCLFLVVMGLSVAGYSQDEKVQTQPAPVEGTQETKVDVAPVDAGSGGAPPPAERPSCP